MVVNKNLHGSFLKNRNNIVTQASEVFVRSAMKLSSHDINAKT